MRFCSHLTCALLVLWEYFQISCCYDGQARMDVCRGVAIAMQDDGRCVCSDRVTRGMNGWVQVLAVIFDVMLSHHTMACWHNAALDRHAQDTVHLQVQFRPLKAVIRCFSDPTSP